MYMHSTASLLRVDTTEIRSECRPSAQTVQASTSFTGDAEPDTNSDNNFALCYICIVRDKVLPGVWRSKSASTLLSGGVDAAFDSDTRTMAISTDFCK